MALGGMSCLLKIFNRLGLQSYKHISHFFLDYLSQRVSVSFPLFSNICYYCLFSKMSDSFQLIT